jgi:hypothetical protein
VEDEEKEGRRRHRNINGGISEGTEFREERRMKRIWRILSFSIQLSGLTSYFLMLMLL